MSEGYFGCSIYYRLWKCFPISTSVITCYKCYCEAALIADKQYQHQLLTGNTCSILLLISPNTVACISAIFIYTFCIILLTGKIWWYRTFVDVCFTFSSCPFWFAMTLSSFNLANLVTLICVRRVTWTRGQAVDAICAICALWNKHISRSIQ